MTRHTMHLQKYKTLADSQKFWRIFLWCIPQVLYISLFVTELNIRWNINIYRLIKSSYRIIAPCLEELAFQSLWQLANLKAKSVFDSQLIAPTKHPTPPPLFLPPTHTHSHTCCIMAPNNLQQCNRIINGLLWHSPEIYFKLGAHEINL